MTKNNNNTNATTATTVTEFIEFVTKVGVKNMFSGGRCEACPLTGQECEDICGGGCFGNSPMYYDEKGEEHKLPTFVMKGSELAKLPLPYEKSRPVSFDKTYEVSIYTDHDEETTPKGEVIETHRYELSYEEV